MWKNDNKWPILSFEQAIPLFIEKKIKPVSLYEPDHAPWKEFMWVICRDKIKRAYRWVPGQGTRK